MNIVFKEVSWSVKKETCNTHLIKNKGFRLGNAYVYNSLYYVQFMMLYVVRIRIIFLRQSYSIDQFKIKKKHILLLLYPALDIWWSSIRWEPRAFAPRDTQGKNEWECKHFPIPMGKCASLVFGRFPFKESLWSWSASLSARMSSFFNGDVYFEHPPKEQRDAEIAI